MKMTLCRACEEYIVFLKNPETGRSVPVDVDTVDEEDTEFDKDKHVSHFKTCTDPDRFSRRGAQQ